METFICLVFDGEGAIIASLPIAARNTADATVEGTVLLQQTRGAAELEIWRHGDKVRTLLRQGDENAAS